MTVLPSFSRIRRRIVELVSSLAGTRPGFPVPPPPGDSSAGAAAAPRATWPERMKPHLPTLAFLASLVVIFVIRYMAVRQHMDMGQDMANYLTTMNTFFGQDVTGTGLLRPPLIAVPLKVFVLAFGDLTGGKLLGVTMSVAIGIPMYLIAKRVSKPWIAAVVSVLFVLTPAYSNMLTWGYITMFGIFFTFLSVYFFMRAFESGAKRHAFFAGFSGSLVFGFHQLTAAFFVPLCAVLLLALFVLSRHHGGRHWGNAALGVFTGIVTSLPYVPVYIHLLQMQSTTGGSSAVSVSLFTEFTYRLWYLPWTAAAVVGILVTLAALVSLWRHDRNAAILVGTLLLFPLLLLLFTFPPPFLELNRRAHYFLYVPIWAMTGYVLSLAWEWRPSSLRPPFRTVPRFAVTALLVLLVIYGSVLSQRDITAGLGFYAYLDETRWDAVQFMKTKTPRDAVVAAYPEHLGWWIEGVARRKDFEVTDRDMEASDVERERALIAEFLLSRNQGMRNGYVRAATSYPYTDAPGNPVIGLYLGGRYHDLVMFDDTLSSLQIEGSDAFDLNSATGKVLDIRGDGTSLQTVISYHFGDATVIQTVTLEEGRQMAVVTYTIRSGRQAVRSLRLPLLFCIAPKSVSVDQADGHIEIAQEPETQFTGAVPVTMRLSLNATGAAVQTPSMQGDQLSLAFDVNAADASLTLTFDVSAEQTPDSEHVAAYEVPQLIRDNGLDYLAVDLKPDSELWSDMPFGFEEWLNACPYYDLVFSEGDVRIYEIDASALP